MTGRHPLDRSAAFTALLEFCPGFGKTEAREAGRIVTRFLDGFYSSGSKDMAAYARSWATASPLGYTTRAVTAITEAARAEHDFGGWLADVLARVAAGLGSSDALTAGRPGSWEASLVDQLVKGTVGHDDEFLGGYRDGAS